MEDLERVFLFPLDEMKRLSEYMSAQMALGLIGENSDLKMLPSFVISLATGDERGLLLAVELGGSKVRVAKVFFEGCGKVQILNEISRSITAELKMAENNALFEFIAQCIKDIEPDNGMTAGFTFSYPCNLTSQKSGTILEWTKDINASSCIGEDPVKLLQEACQKLGVNVRIVSLCNDSVSTLVSYSYTHQETAMGVILGSGTNAAYVERVANIGKLKAQVAAPNMIVNMEWGALGTSNPSLLPRSTLDEEIDKYSSNPGKQYLEKLMSGIFLGELTRLWITRLRQEKKLLCKTELSNRLFTERMCLQSRFCTSALLDDSDGLTDIESTLQDFGISNSSNKDRILIQHIVDRVITRSARLMGTCLFTVLSHMKENGLSGCVGLDGSVYKYVPGYKVRMLKAMKELGMEGLECGIAQNGSCVGSALIAYFSS